MALKARVIKKNESAQLHAKKTTLKSKFKKLVDIIETRARTKEKKKLYERIQDRVKQAK